MRGAISLDPLLCTSTNTAYHQSWLSNFNMKDFKNLPAVDSRQSRDTGIPNYVSEASTTELELH